jgi:hypothetical protein
MRPVNTALASSRVKNQPTFHFSSRHIFNWLSTWPPPKRLASSLPEIFSSLGGEASWLSHIGAYNRVAADITDKLANQVMRVIFRGLTASI